MPTPKVEDGSRPPEHRTYGRQSVPERAWEAWELYKANTKLKDIATKFQVSIPAVRNWITAVREANKDKILK